MAITVKNLMELPSLQDFRLTAGRSGLENVVEKTGIVDYEFVDGFPIDEELAFERNSFVISSLLFAKDDEDALLRAVRSLSKYGVSALGIKTVFYKEIPEPVKAAANEEGFPIFLFDKAYFEDVIADLRQAIQSDQLLGFERERLLRLYREELSPKEVKRLGFELHPTLRRWTKAYYCGSERSYSDWELSRILSGFAKNAARKQETAAFYFESGFLFLVSADSEDAARFELQFADALHFAGFSPGDFIIGESSAHLMETELHLAIREAVCAQRGAVLKGRSQMSVRELGVLRVLLWRDNDSVLKRYAGEYLKPISGPEQEGNAEFLNTATFYVRTGGSIPETAKLLFVHDNTVRYRIGRIRERLNPGAGDYEFFQNLSAAIWITLAEQKGFL